MHRERETIRTIARLALPLLLACTVAGCGDDDEGDAILPLQARFAVAPPTADPAVFFRANPGDTNPVDDVVVVDVMLQSTGVGGTSFNGFTMEIRFDPLILQIGQVDLTATPFGNCTGTAGLTCFDNASTTSDPANETGTLLLGVGTTAGTPPVNVTGTSKLFTLRFIGATLGTSTIDFIDAAGTGDCEILDAALNDLNVTCESGGATVTVAR